MIKTSLSTKRTSVSFRFQPKTLKILDKLTQQTQRNRTQLVEEALLDLEKKIAQENKDHPLARFAGILNDQEAENILDILHQSHEQQLQLQSKKMSESHAL